MKRHFLLPMSIVSILFCLSLAQATTPAPCQYFVPSSNAKTPAFQYDCTSSGIFKGGGNDVDLHFTLPDELVGANPVENVLTEMQSGFNSIRTFSNGSITAACSEGKSNMTCVLGYLPIYAGSIDALSAQKVIETRFAQKPILLKLKLQQASFFAHDPQGTLILFK